MREGGERERNQLPSPTISTHLLQVIYSSHPHNTASTTSPSTSQLNTPFPFHVRSPSLSSCLSLHPRSQSGQAVFTAEVIGVVRREPDPGPAKAKDMCVCVRVLLLAFVCARAYALLYIRLFVMTGSEARQGKQALASVSPLGSRQIGFYYAVCLFLSPILCLSSLCISLRCLKDNHSRFLLSLALQHFIFSWYSFVPALFFYCIFSFPLFLCSSFCLSEPNR